MKPQYQRECKIDGCENLVGPHGGLGYCNAHYKRHREGRDMHAPIQNRGAGWTSTHGYHYFGKRAAHRRIMEKKVGRKLSYNEIVHHKDGDKTNNDPSNLELMQRGDHTRHHCVGKTNEERREEARGLAGKEQ